MTLIYNQTYQKKTRQTLRNDSPKAEQILWQHLRKNQIKGYKFRRQYGVGPYVIDFFCPLLQIGIEIDGPTHFSDDTVKKYDLSRQRHIEKLGIHVLRFTNEQIYQHLDVVLDAIAKQVEKTTPS